MTLETRSTAVCDRCRRDFLTPPQRRFDFAALRAKPLPPIGLRLEAAEEEARRARGGRREGRRGAAEQRGRAVRRADFIASLIG